MGKKTDVESVHLVNHSKCMMAAFQNFRQDETMLDVTLACNGQSMKAHKLLLSACSPFFKDIFAENPCAHPIIILRDFEFSDLKAVIDFIYKGELSVPRERLMSALKVAEELHVRGLRRSEPSAKKYEKLYNQVCAKLPSRKKRKRRRHNSSDSDVKQYFNVSDSDENVVESEKSLNDNGESILQLMDVEEGSMNDQDSRPVVLRVGDKSVSNEESNSRDVLKEEDCSAPLTEEAGMPNADLLKETLIKEEAVETQILDPVSENIASSSQLDSFVECPESSDCLQESVPIDEQSGFQADINEISINQPISSEEKVSCISLSLCPPEPSEGDGQKVPDEGKRFVCSKCNCVFSSRISFMRHKMEGHRNTDSKNSYKCAHCTFSTDDLESLRNHQLTHSNKVPLVCNTCSEEFTSQEIYEKHLAVHEENTIPMRDLSLKFGHGLFSAQSKVQEKLVLFRCSVCFTKFTSKLSCQLHEKSCQGGS